MSWGMVVVAGASLVGAGINYFGQKAAAETQAKAAKDTAQLQHDTAVGADGKGGYMADMKAQQAAADERMYGKDGVGGELANVDAAVASGQTALNPYIEQGGRAWTAAGDLSGANGADAQGAAVNGIQNGAIFQGMQEQGNRSILQAQAATGGLRTGTTQDILAQYSPQLLNNLIQQQFGNNRDLGAMGMDATDRSNQLQMNGATVRTNAAAGLSSQLMQGQTNMSQLLQGSVNNQTGYLNDAAAAEAGGYLAQANALANGVTTLGGLAGTYLDSRPVTSDTYTYNNNRTRGQGRTPVNPATAQ